MLKTDLIRIALILTTAVLAGWMTGHVLVCLSVAALGYVAWLHHSLSALLGWVLHRKQHEPPESPGVFEELTLAIDQLRERHKKRKKKLRNYLKQFRQATRALPDATLVIDDGDVIQWANAAAGRFLGIKWPSDAGRRLTDLVRSPKLHAFLAERKEDAMIELPCPIDPAVQLSIRLAPYGPDQWLFVARDITQLHRANQIRSDFVANVSHELRTPITVIRGYLENLQRQIDLCPEPWLTPLHEMTSNAQRMQTLVEDLLLLSRLEQADRVRDPKPVPVAGLLSDIHRQARGLSDFGDRIFALEIDPDLAIRGDSEELYSAFSNLVFNAVRYTPPHGIVDIRWYSDPDGAHLEVSDNGVGIEPEHIPRITERFYRVDPSRSRSHGGTGLGLAIVKHVLNRHDATLRIVSEPGRGSTFRCDFPESAIVDAEPEIVDRSA